MFNAIFLIIPSSDVDNFLANSHFTPTSLQKEGFIHACTPRQVDYVLDRFYKNKAPLSLITIDTSLVEADIQYEAATRNSELGLFPHIYGPLNIDAVIDVCDITLFSRQDIPSSVLKALRHYRFNRLPVESTLYKNTWRSNENNHHGDPIGTAMIGMYCNVITSLSCFHKLEFDEIWHFYSGDPLELTLLYPQGTYEKVIMGSDFSQGQVSQLRIPAGVWQGGCLKEGGEYAIFGCTLAPGFTGRCFTAGIANELIEQYPDCKEVINKLSINGHETKMPKGFAN